MKKLIAVVVALALTGCATNYDQYANAQVKIAEAQALQAKYKYEALVLMSKDGSDAAKVAAVMTMGQVGSSQNLQSLAAPKSWQDLALQWASILVPSVTQMYSISTNKDLSLAQTAASVQNSSTQMNGMVEFGKMINAPTIVNQPAPLVVQPVVVPQQVVQPQVVQIR